MNRRVCCWQCRPPRSFLRLEMHLAFLSHSWICKALRAPPSDPERGSFFLISLLSVGTKCRSLIQNCMRQQCFFTMTEFFVVLEALCLDGNAPHPYKAHRAHKARSHETGNVKRHKHSVLTGLGSVFVCEIRRGVCVVIPSFLGAT